MMTPTSPERIRQDTKLVRQTLLKLSLGRMTTTAIGVVVAIVIWLLVASWLLDFGRSLRFDALQALGQQAVSVLERVNPYLWWVVVAIWTLIVFFLVRGGVRASFETGRATPVPTDALSGLTRDLSDEVKAVLRWVWGDRDEPFTLGDLQRAHEELRHNRIGKIAMVQEQSTILDAPAQQTPPAAGNKPAAPVVSAPASRSVPQPPRHIEPRIGDPE